MTAGERAELRLALDFLREWRDDDKRWKEKTDRRLDKLEAKATAAEVLAEIDEKREASEYRKTRLRFEGDNARWAAIAVIAGGVPLVLRFLGW